MPTTQRQRPYGRPSHEEQVLSLLRQHGALTRSKLGSLLDLSRTSLSNVTAGLLEQGAIVVADTDAAERAGSGRPAEKLALDPQAGQFLGIDFGHRRVHAVLADASHQVIARAHAGYDDVVDWASRTDIAFQMVDRMTAENDVHIGALRAIALGVPGFMASESVRTTLPGGWSGTAVRSVFEDRYGAPAVIDNNTRLAALAEASAAGPKVADVIYVRLSDGIGGGVIAGGQLVSGSVGLAGEIGHVRVVAEGLPCHCGKSGCLETVASVPAILRECSSRGIGVMSLEDLAAEVDRRHPEVDEILRAAGSALGHALASPAMILNPAQIIIGGAVIGIAPSILSAASDTLRFELFGTPEAAPIVRAATFGDEGGAIGALMALFHRTPV